MDNKEVVEVGLVVAGQEDDDLENACRLCLTTEQTRTSIFGVPNVSLPFVEKINTCLAIQVC